MCMKILITIKTDSELQSYEATALAFLLASFNHDVQLYFANHVFNILNYPPAQKTRKVSFNKFRIIINKLYLSFLLIFLSTR